MYLVQFRTWSSGALEPLVDEMSITTTLTSVSWMSISSSKRNLENISIKTFHRREDYLDTSSIMDQQILEASLKMSLKMNFYLTFF